MREDSIRAFITEAGKEWILVEHLLRDEKIVESKFNGSRFYLRKFKHVNDSKKG